MTDTIQTDGFALVEPNPGYKEKYLDMMQEWTAYGGRLNPCALFCQESSYEKWLAGIEEERNEETCPPGFVPQYFYFLVDSQDHILGAITIRVRLNEYLLLSGGHIGYGIRPSERRKGCATVMLALALQKCRAMGLQKVLVTCDKENVGSAKTIQKNGGVLENEIRDDGIVVQRYWIVL